MGQRFFVLNRRYESLGEKGDPLVAIAAMVAMGILPAQAEGGADRRRAARARSGAQEFGGTQALRRNRGLQGAGVAGARQSALPAPKLCSSIARRWPAGTAEELFDLFLKDKGDLARAKRYRQGELRPCRRWELYPRHEAGAIARCLRRAFIRTPHGILARVDPRAKLGPMRWKASCDFKRQGRKSEIRSFTGMASGRTARRGRQRLSPR